MRSNARSPGGSPVKNVAKYLQRYLRDSQCAPATQSLPNRAVDLVELADTSCKGKLISKLSCDEGLGLRNRQTGLQRGLFLGSALISALCASSVVSVSSCFWASDNLPAGAPSGNRSQRSSAITSIRLETERFSKEAICSSLFRCSSRTVRLSFALLLFYIVFCHWQFFTLRS